MTAAAFPVPTSAQLNAPPLYHRGYRARGGPERKVFDAEYVRKLTLGDPETEAHFTSYFGDLLVCKLRGRLRSPQLMEDARQETFLRVLDVLRNKGGVQHPERLGAFVNSVCDNVLSEFYRAGSRYQQTPENATEPADKGVSAETRMEEKQKKEMIRGVLRQMAPKDQQILQKVFLEERDKDDICREMSIDRNYLRVRVHRALERFRSVLEKQPTKKFSAGNMANG